MDEMRGRRIDAAEGLLIVTHNRITRQHLGIPRAMWVSFWLENRFPHFGENALTMGRKKFQCRCPAETVEWS